MDKSVNYFKVGLFALFGVVILVAGIVTFGAGAIFKEKVIFETYYDEPISGLELGSIVKFQGVEVGVVKDIAFAFNHYPTDREYVVVRFEIFLDKIGVRKNKGRNLTSRERFELVDRMVKNGLRVELTPQGVTGMNFLNAIYFEPKKYPPLEIEWEPKYQYIPSAPGAVNIVVEAIQNVGEILEIVDFAHLVEDMHELLANTNEIMSQFKSSSIGEDLDGFFEDIRSSLVEIEKLTANMNSLVVSKETKANLRNISETLENIKATTDNLPETVENLKEVSEDLNDLTNDIRKYPSLLLFGNPPPKIN